MLTRGKEAFVLGVARGKNNNVLPFVFQYNTVRKKFEVIYGKEECKEFIRSSSFDNTQAVGQVVCSKLPELWNLSDADRENISMIFGQVQPEPIMSKASETDIVRPKIIKIRRDEKVAIAALIKPLQKLFGKFGETLKYKLFFGPSLEEVLFRVTPLLVGQSMSSHSQWLGIVGFIVASIITGLIFIYLHPKGKRKPAFFVTISTTITLIPMLLGISPWFLLLPFAIHILTDTIRAIRTWYTGEEKPMPTIGKDKGDAMVTLDLWERLSRAKPSSSTVSRLDRRRERNRNVILESQIIFNPLNTEKANDYIKQFQTFLSDRELVITDGYGDYEIENILDNQEVVYSARGSIKWICFANRIQEGAYFFLIIGNDKPIGHGRFMFTPGCFKKMVDFMYYITPEETKGSKISLLCFILANIYHKTNKRIKAFRIPAVIRYKEAGRMSRYEDIIQSGTLAFFVLNGFQAIPVTQGAKKRVDEAMQYITSPVATKLLPKSMERYYYEILACENLFLSLESKSEHVEGALAIVKQDKSDPHPPYRVISVKNKHSYAVTVTCGLDFIPDEFQPACGGVIFIENKDEFQKSEIEKILLEKATSLARDTDRTSALWNNYMRGGATIILSDGEKDKKNVLNEWAGCLAKKGLLGWKYIVTSDLGTTEEDMSNIVDSAYEAGLGKIKIVRSILKEWFEPLWRKVLWKRGLVLPAAGAPEEKGGYPPFAWVLGAIGEVSALRVISWFRNVQGRTGKRVVPDIKENPDIIVDGFGFTGRSLIRALINRLPDEVRIVGASDEHGEIYNPSGLDSFTMLELIKQKEKGGKVNLSRDYEEATQDKSKLLAKEADILILANRRRTLEDNDIKNIQARIVMEAVPGILSEDQIEMLYKKGILYISSLWLNGGILFGSGREPILHTLVPEECEAITDMRLHVQSGVSESALAMMFEELDRCQSAIEEGQPRPQAWKIGRDMAAEIRIRESDFWTRINKIAEKHKVKPEKLIRKRKLWYKEKRLIPVFRQAEVNRKAGRNPALALFTAVSEIARQQVIYGKRSRKRAVITLDTDINEIFNSVQAIMGEMDRVTVEGIVSRLKFDDRYRINLVKYIVEQSIQLGKRQRFDPEEKDRIIEHLRWIDNMEKRLAAFHLTRLGRQMIRPQLLKRVTDILLKQLEHGATYHIRANCAHALGFIYSQHKDKEIKREIERALVSSFSDLDEEVGSWAKWAININGINLKKLRSRVLGEIIGVGFGYVFSRIFAGRIKYVRFPIEIEAMYSQLGRLYQIRANIYDFNGRRRAALWNRKHAQKVYRKAGAEHGLLALHSWLILARSYHQLGDMMEEKPPYGTADLRRRYHALAVREYLNLVNPALFAQIFGRAGVQEFFPLTRSLALEGILNIYYPYNVDTNILISDRLTEAIKEANERINLEEPLDAQLKIIFEISDKELNRYRVAYLDQGPYLGLLLIYGTEIFSSKEYKTIQDALRHILMYHSLTDENGEKLPDKKIEELIKFNRDGVFAKLEPEQRNFILKLFRRLKIISKKEAGEETKPEYVIRRTGEREQLVSDFLNEPEEISALVNAHNKKIILMKGLREHILPSQFEKKLADIKKEKSKAPKERSSAYRTLDMLERMLSEVTNSEVSLVVTKNKQILAGHTLRVVRYETGYRVYVSEEARLVDLIVHLPHEVTHLFGTEAEARENDIIVVMKFKEIARSLRKVVKRKASVLKDEVEQSLNNLADLMELAALDHEIDMLVARAQYRLRNNPAALQKLKDWGLGYMMKAPPISFDRYPEHLQKYLKQISDALEGKVTLPGTTKAIPALRNSRIDTYPKSTDPDLIHSIEGLIKNLPNISKEANVNLDPVAILRKQLDDAELRLIDSGGSMEVYKYEDTDTGEILMLHVSKDTIYSMPCGLKEMISVVRRNLGGLFVDTTEIVSMEEKPLTWAMGGLSSRVPLVYVQRYVEPLVEVDDSGNVTGGRLKELVDAYNANADPKGLVKAKGLIKKYFERKENYRRRGIVSIHDRLENTGKDNRNENVVGFDLEGYFDQTPDSDVFKYMFDRCSARDINLLQQIDSSGKLVQYYQKRASRILTKEHFDEIYGTDLDARRSVQEVKGKAFQKARDRLTLDMFNSRLNFRVLRRALSTTR
ncbi:MAG: hypothetical protein ACETVO_07145, partial [bacterium]